MDSRRFPILLLPAVLFGFATIAPCAEKDPAAWEIDVVDSRGPGKYSSMKADKNGNLHVAYVLSSIEDVLYYGFWDARMRRWFTMPVAKGSGVCSLALDSQQRPHISFTDAGSGIGAKLRRAVWNGTKWQIEAIPLNSEIIAYYNSIALDAEDRASLSFYEYRGPAGSDISIRMRVVGWNGTHWQVRTVDQEQGSGKFNSIAYDSKGGLHLAYANVSHGSMRYAYWDGKTWKKELVDTPEMNGGAYVGFSVFITIDKDDRPHIAYMNQSGGLLKYAVRTNNKWEIQAVDGIAGVAYPDRNSLITDDQGRPYIGYYDAGRGTLKLAYREGSRWIVHIVDTGGSGFTSSIQIARDQLWISYADDVTKCFKTARVSLSALRQTTLVVPVPEDRRVQARE